MTRPWRCTETEAGLLHVRAGIPDRWDIAVRRVWAVGGPVSRRRYARQVRQDIWRAARAVRGFVPRVLVARTSRTIEITGGGTCLGARPPVLAQRIATLLDNPANRARWDAFARRAP